MKKRVFALLLTLSLAVGLLIVPAAAAPAMSAYEAVQALESYQLPSSIDSAPLMGKFFVDFNQDGIPEMVAIFYRRGEEHGALKVYYVTDSGSVAPVTGYYAGLGDDDAINFYTAFGGHADGSIVQFSDGTYGLRSYGYHRFGSEGTDAWRYQGNGTFAKSTNMGTALWSFEAYSVTMPDKYAFFAPPAQPVAPSLPDVPAAPLGSGLTVAKAEAIAALENVSYYGDRAAITMTEAQAKAILNQMAYYASAPALLDYPGLGVGTAYAALFDTGAGVPGLFMAKGYCLGGGQPSAMGDGSVSCDFGECAIWTFQDGKLDLFSPAIYSLNYTLYPACVEQYIGAPDGSYTELRYFPMNYGSLSNTPTTVVTKMLNEAAQSYSYTVDGSLVTAAQEAEFEKVWQGTGQRAYAQEGGGVEYRIYGMTPVDQMTGALNQFVANLSASFAYPSTQEVDVDGRKVEFQCYALRDAAGFETNYIKLRDLAEVLSGTLVRFDVDWDGDIIIIPGRKYTPNGTEHSTPFTGPRAYERPEITTRVNDYVVYPDTFQLKDDNGGGYTYYKLRDLGNALGFVVDWSAERGVYIETK